MVWIIIHCDENEVRNVTLAGRGFLSGGVLAGLLEAGRDVTVPKILIVEADDDLRNVLLDATEDRFDVEAVRSGAAMRATLARSEPDVVLLNMSLPADDAVALAEHAAQRGCVVIAVPDEPSQFAEAASRGYYILVRPLTRRRVGETIERALRRAAPTRA